MKKIQTVTLPQDALSGLIHGFWHHGKNTDEPKSLFYVDVTERSATDALYSILKRESLVGVQPIGYNTATKARGVTSPATLAVVLSNNLHHIDRENMTDGLRGIFNSLARTTHTNDTQITVYGEPGVEKLIRLVADDEYGSFSEASAQHEPVCGSFDLKSNITIDNFVSMAIDPDFKKFVEESPGREYFLGENFVFMHYDDLAKVVRMATTSGKRVVMHPVLHRYYFDNLVCTFKP